MFLFLFAQKQEGQGWDPGSAYTMDHFITHYRLQYLQSTLTDLQHKITDFFLPYHV
jgi:hypothetical protein